MREGVEQEEMKEEDVEEDEEELLEEEQLVVKEGRKNLDGGRAGSGRRVGVGVESAVAAVHSFGGAAATLFLPTFLFTAGPVHKYVE